MIGFNGLEAFLALVGVVAIAYGGLKGIARRHRRPRDAQARHRRAPGTGEPDGREGGAASAAGPQALDRPLDARTEALRRKSLIAGLLIDYRGACERRGEGVLPARFPDLLDAAEPYINQRLAERGEAWSLDEAVRAALGLPPRGR